MQAEKDSAARLNIERMSQAMSSERFGREQKVRGAELVTSSMTKASQKELGKAYYHSKECELRPRDIPAKRNQLRR